MRRGSSSCRRAVRAAIAAGLVLAVTGCGSGGGQGDKPDLTVAAATSLKTALTAYGPEFSAARLRFSFAGSDQLAVQIQRGVKPDVFVSANTTLPEMLYAKGLVSRPVVFTDNRLVIAVPAASSRIRSLADLARPGIRIAMGSDGVPVGSYTRKVLSRLPAAQRRAILDNVRSEEPDVGGVIAKVTQKAVDAGFVYATDVAATSGKAAQVAVPDNLQPRVSYAVAVVKGTRHAEQASAFVEGLLSGRGRQELRNAGFLPPGR